MNKLAGTLASSIFFMVLGGLLTYFIFQPSKPVIKTIKVNNFDSLTTVQNARLGWYPQSTIDSLTHSHYQIAKVKWIDSLNVRDSLAIHDTTIYHFVSNEPYFYADSTYHTVAIQNKATVNLWQKLHQEFYPTREVFRTQLVTDSLTVQYPEPSERKFHLVLSAGYGVGYKGFDISLGVGYIIW